MSCAASSSPSGRPEAEITTYFPPADRATALARRRSTTPLIFRSVEKHLGIRMAAAQLTVRAETADSQLARKLDYEEGARGSHDGDSLPDGRRPAGGIDRRPAPRRSLQPELRRAERCAPEAGKEMIQSGSQRCGEWTRSERL